AVEASGAGRLRRQRPRHRALRTLRIRAGGPLSGLRLAQWRLRGLAGHGEAQAVSGRLRKLGPAHVARLERFMRRARAAQATRASAPPLTETQKNASHPRLCCPAVAPTQRFLTFQENDHARLL